MRDHYVKDTPLALFNYTDSGTYRAQTGLRAIR